MEDLSVILPVFRENHKIIDKIAKELGRLNVEVIIVDDGSEKPYPKSIKHGVNHGYGSALLTGIKNATRPLICTMDSDGQHTVADVVNLYVAWRMMKTADMVIGSRRLKGTERWYRMLGRKTLNWIASLVTGQYFQDLNSGMRIFKRSVALGYAPILCRSFSFTTSLTISMLCDDYRIESFPINVEPRQFGGSKVRVLTDGIVTLWFILFLGAVMRTRRIRAWLRKLRGVKETNIHMRS